jgi:tryptophan-rich sensory protein
MNWLLYANIFIPILSAIIMNYIIYSNNWQYEGKKYNKEKKISNSNKLLPPGYIIGIIWIIIFGLLGYVHYQLYMLKNKSNIASWFVILFIIFSLAYPLLTNGLQEDKTAFLLNLITLILAFILALLVIVKSVKIFYYLIPLLLWASYVNIIYAV